MNNDVLRTLGKGMTFPIRIQNGTVKSETGYELIRSCIYNILSFEFGQRYFQRDFGVALEPLLSEPNDLVTEALLDYRIRTQLDLWDTRIIVEDVTVSRPSFEKLHVIVRVGLSGQGQGIEIDVPINEVIG